MNAFKDRELESLLAKVFELGCHCEKALTNAIWALSHGDKELARAVADGDDPIDALAAEINTESFQMIARYQPVALDLRALEACIRMALDLERISDLAVTVARTTLTSDTDLRMTPGLVSMGERVVDMLNKTMTALLKRDVEMAKSVFAMDDMVDDYEDSVFTDLMEIVKEDPEFMNSAGRLITVARVVERAGDHVTNMCEQICYMMTGMRIKASEYRRPKGDR